MIDIHTHILPGIDDGAADIYDSIEMAALAYEFGTEVTSFACVSLSRHPSSSSLSSLRPKTPTHNG